MGKRAEQINAEMLEMLPQYIFFNKKTNFYKN
jgi:hypothetical protein